MKSWFSAKDENKAKTQEKFLPSWEQNSGPGYAPQHDKYYWVKVKKPMFIHHSGNCCHTFQNVCDNKPHVTLSYASYGQIESLHNLQEMDMRRSFYWQSKRRFRLWRKALLSSFINPYLLNFSLDARDRKKSSVGKSTKWLFWSHTNY